MGMKTILSGLMILGVVLGVLPLVAGNFSDSGVRFIHFLWMIPGLVFIFISVIGLIFASLYVRAKGNLAFVRTGQGGRKIILDHGSIVIGFLHEIIPVSLETMKIVVKRTGKDSLITLDKLRAEVVAEFYIRVKADKEGIATAARTLGDKVSAVVGGKKYDQMDSELLVEAQQTAINQLEKEKLIDALRTVAAKSVLEGLNLKRDEFKKGVIEVVKDGLKENGLELEDCTISALDQAPMKIMESDNIFDAQGLKNLQQVISEQSIARNEFEKNAELAIKSKNVETEKAILEQDQDLKFKISNQERDVRAYKAEQDKMAREAELASEEAVGKRAIEKENAIQISGVKSEEEVSTREVAKRQKIDTAEVEKNKTVEVAERDQEITIAKKEAERATAEEARQIAEALAEKARQDVESVKILESAERDKKQNIISKEAEVEQERIEEQMKADVQAYATAKDAEGRKQAAEADFEAKTKAAEADFITKDKAAEGDKAKQMVPVEVSARQVVVDKDRVETVLKPELAAKSEHQQVSVELTLGQLKINAEKEVGIALATALGSMMNKANMNIYGDPETVVKMTEKFMNGHGISQTIDGFLQKADGLKGILPAIAPLAEKLGIKLPGDVSGEEKKEKKIDA
ncbi:hypothetical protein KAI56_05135 [Candidatus Parcubacteria bacterium]|nr:hypothetical protein [Candidatus Parcubacteria bacterium]